MNNSIEDDTPNNDFHGFDTLARLQENKINFDAAGKEGLISFIKACIASGICTSGDIMNEAERVTGRHVCAVVAALLDQYEDIHWVDDGERIYLSNLKDYA